MTTGTEIDVDAIISGSTKKEEPEQPKAGKDDIESSPAGIRRAESKDSNGPNIGSSVSDHLFHMKERILNPYGNEEEVVFEKEAAEEAAGDEDDMEQALSEDIYSLMSTVPTCSISMGFAIVVFMIQFLIIILVLLDLIDTTSNPRKTNGTNNRMGIPVDTPFTVRAAQFVGVILIVNFGAGEGDLLEGFSHLLNGYDAQIIKENPHATRIKWYIASACQLLVGTGLTVNLFVLMMRSTSNIELCLNFAALHFVQDIDNVAFTMGAMGLINRRVQKDCNHVGNVMIHANKSRRNAWIKRGFLLLLTVVLYTLFFVIAGWQWNGRFMCHTLYVQLGDVHGPEWPYYSGLFDTIGHNFQDRVEDRPVYLDAMTKTIRLAYCSGEEAWTLSNITETNDHCNYFIKSSTTTTYDIMDVAAGIWYALDPDLGDVPMDWLLMDCNDCNQQICAPDVGTCSKDNNRCECKDDRMGINCEFRFEDACDFMALDRRSKASLSALPFAALFTRKEYTKYWADNGRINQLYDRPFYVSYTNTTPAYVEVFIIFTGYRWIIYGVPQEQTPNTTLEEFDSYLIANDPMVNPLQTLSTISSDTLPYFEPLFFSSPVKFETESHEVDPINVRWVLAQIDESLPQVGAYPDVNHPVSASFLCSLCNANNTCHNGGTCHDTKCDCTDPDTGVQSYGGNMCEYAFSCIEFEAREKRLLNGCECDPVFGICIDCDPGYYGNLCQYERDGGVVVEAEIDATGLNLGVHYQCDNSTCLNGGYCTNIASPCTCLPMFDGNSCEDLKLLCTNTTCQNGGFCSNDVTDSCICPNEFGGEFCAVPILPLNYTVNATTTSNETGAELLLLPDDLDELMVGEESITVFEELIPTINNTNV